MRVCNETLIPSCDIINCQCTQSANTKVFTHIRSDDIPMYNTTLYLIDSITAILLWFNLRKISEEATCEGIACASRVYHFFKGIGRSAKESSVSAKKQCSITTLLYYDILQTHIE